MSVSRGAGVQVECARALGAPFVPAAIAELERCGSYFEAVWSQLAPSVATAGFLGSALYMADMALDAVEAVYLEVEPVLTRESLLDGVLTEAELRDLEAVLDVFHWLQPQLLLMLAALTEGWDAPRVGGQGRPDPRQPSERERAHIETAVAFAPAEQPPLPEVAEALQVASAPDLYRAVAHWPRYLEAAWDELQHLVAYPLFRQRGRALYYYARSSTRFLAQPIEVSRDALLARGVAAADLDAARAVLDAALPSVATMMMHCSAMRAGLGLTTREVVRPA
jgi:hypothetical protein